MTLRQPAGAVLESNFLVEQKVINQVLLIFHARRPDRLTLMFSLWKGSTDLRDFVGGINMNENNTCRNLSVP